MKKKRGRPRKNKNGQAGLPQVKFVSSNKDGFSRCALSGQSQSKKETDEKQDCSLLIFTFSQSSTLSDQSQSEKLLLEGMATVKPTDAPKKKRGRPKKNAVKVDSATFTSGTKLQELPKLESSEPSLYEVFENWKSYPDIHIARNNCENKKPLVLPQEVVTSSCKGKNILCPDACCNVENVWKVQSVCQDNCYVIVERLNEEEIIKHQNSESKIEEKNESDVVEKPERTGKSAMLSLSETPDSDFGTFFQYKGSSTRGNFQRNSSNMTSYATIWDYDSSDDDFALGCLVGKKKYRYEEDFEWNPERELRNRHASKRKKIPSCSLLTKNRRKRSKSNKAATDSVNLPSMDNSSNETKSLEVRHSLPLGSTRLGSKFNATDNLDRNFTLDRVLQSNSCLSTDSAQSNTFDNEQRKDAVSKENFEHTYAKVFPDTFYFQHINELDAITVLAIADLEVNPNDSLKHEIKYNEMAYANLKIVKPQNDEIVANLKNLEDRRRVLQSAKELILQFGTFTKLSDSFRPVKFQGEIQNGTNAQEMSHPQLLKSEPEIQFLNMIKVNRIIRCRNSESLQCINTKTSNTTKKM